METNVNLNESSSRMHFHPSVLQSEKFQKVTRRIPKEFDMQTPTYKVSIMLMRQVFEKEAKYDIPEPADQFSSWFIGSMIKFIANGQYDELRPAVSLEKYLKCLVDEIPAVADVFNSLNQKYYGGELTLDV